MKDRKQPPIYAFPRLSTTDLLFARLGGSGLGNLMFTWARCLVESEHHGWRMIWPTWQSFKPKNWKFNPYDHRTYSDLFRPNERYVTGWRKPRCLARYRWIPEREALNSPVAPGSVVEFRGMEGKFAPFRDDHSLVYKELLGITREKHLAAFSGADPAPVGIHVRRGDFVQQASYDEMVNVDNSVLPLDWYIDTLKAVREKAGEMVPAFVFSDGTEEELEALVSMPRVKRVDYGSGLGDMFGLSRSRLLIASGSTFSMWGSYLGQVPTIWHPKKLLQHVLIEHPEFEIEWSPGDPLPDWVTGIGAAGGSREARLLISGSASP
jgi:hypothetical protein